MKTKALLAATGAFILIISVAVIFFITKSTDYFNPDFATEISLKFYYDGKKIDAVVTDEKDIEAIKENLTEISYKDNPSCGFSTDISISFSGGDKSFTVCPARDSCSTAKIDNSNKYINIKDREALEAVLEKYGFTFPCV